MPPTRKTIAPSPSQAPTASPTSRAPTASPIPLVPPASQASPAPPAPSDFLPPTAIAVNGSLWIEHEGQRFFGPGPVELLEHIDQTGSINQAAKKMDMSYKKAWGIINNLNATATHPLVITATGGQKGGGSTISTEAKLLIAYYRELRERFRQFLEAETARIRK